ncbi:uncharacterized protein BO97DRAFT_73332 [Aspergillus homomorphus CBS 101889]|uniref:Transmembrane protein n=1 Tax=Aspergillus homomorphus (strain CBS 101889) TaxID=1450537 RepID=A0A395IEU4_ASPHC|nr:hypothetical protein BO97DRAFT_73332 [Aspergillus homomorphus CBS 101889]RAL16694.1 hypothetical protein BO97DRAFT_73332 [Aspergillus homomorphus CBS 101889]
MRSARTHAGSPGPSLPPLTKCGKERGESLLIAVGGGGASHDSTLAGNARYRLKDRQSENGTDNSIVFSSVYVSLLYFPLFLFASSCLRFSFLFPLTFFGVHRTRCTESYTTLCAVNTFLRNSTCAVFPTKPASLYSPNDDADILSRCLLGRLFAALMTNLAPAMVGPRRCCSSASQKFIR